MALNEERVRGAIRRSYNAIAEDVGEMGSLEEAVEVAMDADRPRTFGGLTREEWGEFVALPREDQDRIGREALKDYV